MLLSILVPFLWGLILLVLPEFKSRKALLAATGLGLAVAAALGLGTVFGGEAELLLFSFGKNLNLTFRLDQLGRLENFFHRTTEEG